MKKLNLESLMYTKGGTFRIDHYFRLSRKIAERERKRKKEISQIKERNAL